MIYFVLLLFIAMFCLGLLFILAGIASIGWCFITRFNDWSWVPFLCLGFSITPLVIYWFPRVISVRIYWV